LSSTQAQTHACFDFDFVFLFCCTCCNHLKNFHFHAQQFSPFPQRFSFRFFDKICFSCWCFSRVSFTRFSPLFFYTQQLFLIGQQMDSMSLTEYKPENTLIFKLKYLKL